MTEQLQTPPTPSPDAASAGGAQEAGHAEGDRGAAAREWLGQLQAMIENLATQAVPVVREVGAKAAELAAVAADKAGPIAAKAAEVTADAGTRFAERSRSLATELRKDAEAEQAAPGTPAAEAADLTTSAAGAGESGPATDAQPSAER